MHYKETHAWTPDSIANQGLGLIYFCGLRVQKIPIYSILQA